MIYSSNKYYQLRYKKRKTISLNPKRRKLGKNLIVKKSIIENPETSNYGIQKEVFEQFKREFIPFLLIDQHQLV